MRKAEMPKLCFVTEAPAVAAVQLFEGEQDTLDMDRVAELLGVTKKTVQREIKRGKLRCFHVGTRVRITKQALVDYVLESEGA